MFSGSLVAIVTPMLADGGIDLPAWERLLEFHLAAGTRGIVVGGTTGESATLRTRELVQLVQRAQAQLAGRLPVIAGIGTSSTATTVERARELSAVAVDALLVVTPAYNRPTQEGLYRHFEAVASAATVPVILYNVPGRTAVDLLPQTVARLAKLPRIVAVKEAVNSQERIRELVAATDARTDGSGFAVLSGDDATAGETMLSGAAGVVSVTANVVPAAMAALAAAALQGDRAAVARLDAPLAPLHQALFVEANPIPVKWAVAELGLIGPSLRLPLTPLSAQQQPTVSAALRTAGAVASPARLRQA